MIGASANANAAAGSATANAYINTGIWQTAIATGVAGYASAAIVNAGTISVGVHANAFAGRNGSAAASATIGTGVFQGAFGYTSAVVSFANTGTLNVTADASASADEDATAIAGIGATTKGGYGAVVFQSAAASGSEGNASVSFANTGSINVYATANAVGGGDVFASAFANNGIHQVANGGTSGTANANFTNEGPLTINAYATALGGGDGTAVAVATAVEQFAGGGAGASANAYNSNTISVVANADVTVGNAAHRGSYARATATANGIAQHVNGGTGSTSTAGAPVFTDDFGLNAYSSQRMTGVAFTRTESGSTAPTGPAIATLTNTGVLEVSANAHAVGEPGALAYANASAVSQVVAGTKRGGARLQHRHDRSLCIGVRFGSERRFGDGSRFRNSSGSQCRHDASPDHLLRDGQYPQHD